MSALAGWEQVAIMEERRIRYFTIEQLRSEFGEDWPRRAATVRDDADIAVDRLIEAVASNPASRPDDPQFEYDKRMAGVPDE